MLYVIPARGGSKGVPGKNVKLLNGKPLIHYSVDVARSLAPDDDICVSTDDPGIKEIVESIGLKLPFLRPKELATDEASTSDVLIHAVNFYSSIGKIYDLLVLLQPTSPFRTSMQVKEALNLWDDKCDMVVSVKVTKSNPYFVLYEEDSSAFLKKSKVAEFSRRQDCPIVYEFNGSIYVIKVESLLKSPINKFSFIRKYVMDEFHSVDIDSELDWKFAEFLLSEKNK